MGRLLRGLLREPLSFPVQIMNRVAVFVDAGYVFAQGSVLLNGKKLPRSEVVLDHDATVATLKGFAERVSGAALLRIYWYDGTSTGPTAQHLTLAHLNDVKVRLGFVNSVGEQKGVDSLIVTDMIALARNRAMVDAVLISGDEDLRVGVQQAQEFGVRVHLIGIKPSRGSQSLFLLQEADATYEWAEEDVKPFLSCKPRVVLADAPAPAAAPIVGGAASTTGTPLARVAADVAGAVSLTEVQAVVDAYESSSQLPRDVDRQLLVGGRKLLKRDMGPDEKREIRTEFVAALRARSGTSSNE